MDIFWQTIVLLIELVNDQWGHIIASLISYLVPVEMVDTRKLINQIFNRSVQHDGLCHLSHDRHIAQADNPIPLPIAEDSFRHHAAWIGKVDQPGIWTEAFHVLHHFQNDWNGPKGLEHATSSIGFLA